MPQSFMTKKQVWLPQQNDTRIFTENFYNAGEPAASWQHTVDNGDPDFINAGGRGKLAGTVSTFIDNEWRYTGGYNWKDYYFSFIYGGLVSVSTSFALRFAVRYTNTGATTGYIFTKGISDGTVSPYTGSWLNTLCNQSFALTVGDKITLKVSGSGINNRVDIFHNEVLKYAVLGNAEGYRYDSGSIGVGIFMTSGGGVERGFYINEMFVHVDKR